MHGFFSNFSDIAGQVPSVDPASAARHIAYINWVPATPAKVPRRFHYAYLPNMVILATSRSKKVTQSCSQPIPNGFL
jgi:hypothetical protein